MTVRIPKSIDIAGLTIKVIERNDMIKNEGRIGTASYSTQEIFIDTSISATEHVEQSFVHEVVHYILFVMGKKELQNDEEFVDMFSHFIYQSLIK